MLRKTIFLLAVLTFLVMFNGNAHAAAPSSSVDFAALQKKCAVIEVHLNGSQYTIACSQIRSSSTHPNTGQGSCLLSDLTVKNYNYTGKLCFIGKGYLGVQIYSVDEVDNPIGIVSDWIHYYNPSANTCTIQGNQYAYFGTGAPVYLTQIDLNASSGPNCPEV